MTWRQGQDIDPYTAVDALYSNGFVDEWELTQMVAGLLGEGRGRFTNTNNAGLNSDGSIDYGFGNINSVHLSPQDIANIYDPYANARWIRKVFSDRGGGEKGFKAWYGHTTKNGQFGDMASRYMSLAEQYVADYLSGKQFSGQRGGKKLSKADAKQRAQLVVAEMAEAVKRKANGITSVGAGDLVEGVTPSEDGGDVDLEGQVTTFEAGDDAILAEVNAFIEARSPLAAPNELPAEVPAEQREYEGAGIPSVTDREIAQWTATGLRPNAARGAAIARALGFSGTVHGVGSRGNKSDHPHGNAIDLMVSDDREHGNRLAAFFVENAAALGVKYVIWYDQIWSTERADEGWRPYRHPSGNTSNPTLAHRDHPHISFT